MKTEKSLRPHIALAKATISVSLLMIALITGVMQYGPLMVMVAPKGSTLMDAESTSLNDTTIPGPHRKLLLLHEVGEEVLPNRIWGNKCSLSDIVINQGPTSSLPHGIPTYTVEITNVCTTGCDISGIHLTCGWFSSARLVNPHVFKRLGYNDCLVNEGKPLLNGQTLSFQYTNTFPYPLSISSVDC